MDLPALERDALLLRRGRKRDDALELPRRLHLPRVLLRLTAARRSEPSANAQGPFHLTSAATALGGTALAASRSDEADSVAGAGASSGSPPIARPPGAHGTCAPAAAAATTTGACACHSAWRRGKAGGERRRKIREEHGHRRRARRRVEDGLAELGRRAGST